MANQSVSGAQPGFEAALSGTFSGFDDPTTVRIGVTCEGAVVDSVTVTGTQWQASTRFYSAGAKKASVTVSDKLDNHSAVDMATVTVSLATAQPLFTIAAPADGVALRMPEGGQPVTVVVQTDPAFGPRAFDAVVIGETSHDSTTSTTGGASLAPRCGGTPIGARTLQVTCSDPGNIATSVQTLAITVLDYTAPSVRIVSPTDRQVFLADAQGAVSVPFTGTVSDPQSGVDHVEWSLSPDSGWTSVDALDGGGNWRAGVALPTFGAFTIYVRATDRSGNTSVPGKVQVSSVSSYVPPTLDARLDEAHYLFSLLQFADAEARNGTAGLDAAALIAVLAQPFDRLSQTMPDAASLQSVPVNELRVPLEVLRRHPDAPFGTRFSFEPATVSGAAIADADGHGDSGALVGSAAVSAPGRVDSQALEIPDAASGLSVPSSSRLAVGVGDGDFTAALWVQPAGGDASNDWRVMLHKGDETGGGLQRVIGLFARRDLTLHARTSLTGDGNGNVGIDQSSQALEAGRWTHVALVRRGTELCLYLDGRLDSSADLPASPAASNDAPLFVGHDGSFDALPGRYDDVRVYRLALSELAIARLAAGSSATATTADDVIALYCREAYEALLGAFGTSSAELRLARGADAATVSSLAARLGVPVDALSALTLDEPDQTEDALERLFGLRSTDPTLDVLRPAVSPQLLSWRRDTMRLRWAAEDRVADGRSFPVLLDPDVVSASDLAPLPTVDPLAADDPRRLLSERAAALSQYRASLDAARTGGADPADAYARVIAVGLPGIDVGADGAEPALEAAGLSAAAAALVLQVGRLAASGSVMSAEWSDLEDILVEAQKQRLVAEWRGQEAAITLSPDVFVLGGTAPAASPWRAPAAARAEWLSVLSRRVDEQAQLEAGYAAGLAAVEQAILPGVRDGLLQVVADADTQDDAADWLTERYQLDMRRGGVLSTTRVQEAADTLQSTLYAVRTLSLPGWHPGRAWTIPASQTTEFDAGWKWMSEYGAWRTSMQTFLMPERDIDPALIPSPTDPFSTLAQALAAPGLTPAQLTSYLDDYNPKPDYDGDLKTASANALGGKRDPGGGMWQEFCGVPLLIARSFMLAGDYENALAWYRRVYDYELPRGQRPIYAGLALESNTAPTLTFDFAAYQNFNPHTLAAERPNPYTRYTLVAIARCFLAYGDAEFTRGTALSRSRARALYNKALELVDDPALRPITPATPGEGAYANPDVALLTATAESQLSKLRRGLTIAGLPASAAVLADTAAPAQPSQYRYKVLLDRARQLVGQAQQIEAQYLSALEKFDAKGLTIFDATQALGLAGMQVSLQNDRLDEANDNVSVAAAQRQKALSMQATYAVQAAQGPNQYEQQVLAGYGNIAQLKDNMAAVSAGIGTLQALTTAAGGALTSAGTSVGLALATSALYVVQSNLTSGLDQAEAQVSANQLMASVEQRSVEYGLQALAAGEDAKVAAAQVSAANDQVTTAKQEVAIANTQAAQAQDRLNFLQNQFTNADLYQWMSDVLAGVYRYFLQQATAVAGAAQDQLGFERGEPPRTYIAADYWNPPTGSSDSSTDRRGLTGAERLDEDLTRLDQYAFVTDGRRLNLSQTFSLADRAPLEVAEFRRTGTLPFATPMSWFDEAYPGHYLRLIRQVRVSVVALIPPSVGLRATLRSSGISHVATKTADGIVDTVVYGTPEVIAFTAPVNATGVFDADLQPEMLLPFEATGVDTTWQLDLPLQGNTFDFSTIADVLITVDYTAREDLDYRATQIRALNSNRTRHADCVFSLKTRFPDAWYALNNPSDPAAPTATVMIGAVDVPSRLEDLVAENVSVQLLSGGTVPPVTVTLSFAGRSGAAQTTDGGAGTNRGNAPDWSGLCVGSPVGAWTVGLDATAGAMLDTGALEDMLLVIGCAGDVPAWTS